MTRISHPYFGPLDTDLIDDIDVIWGSQKEVNGVEIDLELWSEPGYELSEAALNEVADAFEHLEAIDTDSRKELITYLEGDPTYIEHHRSELPHLHLPEESEKFVSLLSLSAVSITLSSEDSDEETGLCLDYAIAPDESDYLLCVTRKINGEILEIAMES
ncbi:MAG: DUF2004 domain-containing protein [Actinomycetaceae bacterium]|nr:DUF2004 domain-containing protein [Actinomycetaceae bacterium]